MDMVHLGDPLTQVFESQEEFEELLVLAGFTDEVPAIFAHQQMGSVCGVHKHDSWVPLMSHHIRPLGMGGPNVAENRIVLCANGHYAAHAYIAALIKYGEKPPVQLAWHFGPKVRQLAYRGWSEAGKPIKGSGGE